MAQGYTAKMVTGVVHVLSVEGQRRVLREGDRVVRGDTLITGAGARAQLVADDVPPLDLQAERQIKIDDSMFAESAPMPASAALAGGSVAQVVEALKHRDEMPEEARADAAASGDGCGFVRLLRVSEVVTDVDNKFDKLRSASSMKDSDADFIALPDVAQINLTAPGPEPAAPLLLSDVLTSEAEAVFDEAAPGLNVADQVEPGGTVLTAATGLGLTVFTVTLNSAAGTYNVQMVGTVDGGAPVIDFNDSSLYDFQGGNRPWNGFFNSINDNSLDILLTPIKNGVTGGTVNSNANVGGIANPAVGTGEALRVDFVVDLGGNLLSGGDFANPTNQTQTFDGHYVTNGRTATFTVGGGTPTTNVRFSAFDDGDTGVLKNVGDGVPDPVVAISIIYGGSNALVVKPDSGSSQTVTVPVGIQPNIQTFTVVFESDGTATVKNILNGTSIGVYTADGYTTLEYAYQGGNEFAIGNFGGAPIEPGKDVSLQLSVVVTDGDGDAVSSTISLLLEAQDPIGTAALSTNGLRSTDEPTDEGLLTQAVLGMQAIEPEGEPTTEPAPEPGTEEVPPPATQDPTTLEAGLLETDPGEPQAQEADPQPNEPPPTDPQEGEPLLAADLLDGGIEELPLPGQDEPGAGGSSGPSVDIQTYEASLWPTASELPRNMTDPT